LCNFQLGNGTTNARRKTVFKLQRVKNIQKDFHQYIAAFTFTGAKRLLGIEIKKGNVINKVTEQ
jgi:hypothetical protein